MSKTRVFGNGHWMNTFSHLEALTIMEPIGELYQAITRHPNGPLNPIIETIAECKILGRRIKSQYPSRSSLPADIHQSLPDRQLVDELIRLYFSTFETCYRIFHYPSFVMECGSSLNDAEACESSLLLQILLVIAITGPLHEDENVRNNVSAKAHTWIHTAQTWLSAPLEKGRLTLRGIQVHCLLLLARQVHRVGADLIWISAGSLMRMAMQMGLHQDPKYLGEMNPMLKETRRRLWYTILELNLQAALDSGMHPMIATGDWNTEPPSGEPDKDEGSNRESINFQPILCKSIPVRLQATRVINCLREEPSYDQILHIGNELGTACRDVAVAITRTSPTQFAASLCTHMIRRFPLCLHYSFAIKARANPLYTYSRHVGVEAALDIVSLLEDDLYSRVLRCGGGIFRDIITRAAMLIFLEFGADQEAESSMFAKKRDLARQEILLRDARSVVQYAKDRIWHGETNVKIYIFFNIMMAQVEARLNGVPEKEAISRTLHESVDEAHAILKEMVARVPDVTSSEVDSGSGNKDPSLDGFGVLDGDFNWVHDGELDFDFSDFQVLSQW
ncbi:putative C6 transcription factor [Aspergillus ibericus CBS 121593]|uniref:C6 transcription factor n=1 Tax=Aspergillus ibericus CBS 121593 TaxID=1448316 RepID=A0A395H8T1_9EURO|nr:C6 transcription factor [Aspergillus ibericus CBS 121593]RAL02644.1 C6 transcription factor [Aspergillus ibericus CBS 121593]